MGDTYGDSLRLLADGRQAAVQPYVRAGVEPVPIVADIADAQTLDLVVRSTRWDHCHAVWFDPTVSDRPAEDQPREIADCLGRAEIVRPAVPPRAERCIATVVTLDVQAARRGACGQQRREHGDAAAVDSAPAAAVASGDVS